MQGSSEDCRGTEECSMPNLEKIYYSVYIENTFLLSHLVIPNTPVTMVTAQQKMEIKS